MTNFAHGLEITELNRKIRDLSVYDRLVTRSYCKISLFALGCRDATLCIREQ